MLPNPDRLREFEARYQRTAYEHLTYVEALRLFEAMLIEAQAVRPDFGYDWLADLEPDFAVARAINGLPPTS